MKTKLYHKVLKMAFREINADVRPSTSQVFCRIYNPRQKDGVLTVTASKDISAMYGYVAWTEKVGIRKEKDRYDVKSYIREKYKTRSRKYWEPEEVLKRVIRTGSEK